MMQEITLTGSWQKGPKSWSLGLLNSSRQGCQLAPPVHLVIHSSTGFQPCFFLFSLFDKYLEHITVIYVFPQHCHFSTNVDCLPLCPVWFKIFLDPVSGQTRDSCCQILTNTTEKLCESVEIWGLYKIISASFSVPVLLYFSWLLLYSYRWANQNMGLITASVPHST